MKRTLAMLVSLVCLAVAGQAAAKPSIAILGLEVVEDGSGVDTKATQFAESLTEALRQRARTGTGPFTLAPGSDKNLIEMKLLSGCDNEANACMAAIGAELAADRLLYGKVEKRSSGYQVSLKLLNVDTKNAERSTSEVVPFGESSGTALSGWSKKLYAKITGASNQGTLIIKANVDRGTVYLDGEPAGNLVGGTAKIVGLSAGDYQLKVEAECYLAHEAKITVEGGQDNDQDLELEKNALATCGDGGGNGGGRTIMTTGDISDDGRPGGGARALFWTSAAVAVIGGGVWVYGYQQTRSNASGCPIGSPRDSTDPECKAGYRGETLTKIGVPVTAVAGVAAAFFFYKGYIASKRTERPLTARKRGRNVIVAPTVTATEVGGVVHIEF